MEGVEKINSIIRIPTSLKGKFFRIWIEFLTPLHNLTGREKDIVAAFLKERYELSLSISNEDILNRVLMSEDTKSKIKKECNVSSAFFQVIMSKLKKTGIIVNNKINSKFIPKNIGVDDKQFELLLYFDLDEDNNKKTSMGT